MALVVIAGKGGVGKTTVSLGLARMLQVQEADFLLIDADPVGQVHRLLEVHRQRTIADALDSLSNMGNNGGLQYSAVQQLIQPIPAGGHLLSMGHTTTPGCFCRINALTGAVIGMAIRRFGLVIMDAEAGLEHITRGTGQHATRLLLLCDDSRSSFDVAADTLKTVRIMAEAGHRRLNGSAHLGVFLRESGTRTAIEGIAEALHLPRPRFLPYSRKIGRSNLLGLPFPLYDAQDPFFEGLFRWVITDGILDSTVDEEDLETALEEVEAEEVARRA